MGRRHYGRFMAQCERLRLLRGEDLAAWEAEVGGWVRDIYNMCVIYMYIMS